VSHLPSNDIERRRARRAAYYLAQVLGGRVGESHPYDTTLRDTYTVQLPHAWLHVTHNAVRWVGGLPF
jgi:hypothetical protein